MQVIYSHAGLPTTQNEAIVVFNIIQKSNSCERATERKSTTRSHLRQALNQLLRSSRNLTANCQMEESLLGVLRSVPAELQRQ